MRPLPSLIMRIGSIAHRCVAVSSAVCHQGSESSAASGRSRTKLIGANSGIGFPASPGSNIVSESASARSGDRHAPAPHVDLALDLDFP